MTKQYETYFRLLAAAPSRRRRIREVNRADMPQRRSSYFFLCTTYFFFVFILIHADVCVRSSVFHSRLVLDYLSFVVVFFSFLVLPWSVNICTRRSKKDGEDSIFYVVAACHLFAGLITLSFSFFFFAKAQRRRLPEYYYFFFYPRINGRLFWLWKRKPERVDRWYVIIWYTPDNDNNNCFHVDVRGVR